MEKIPFIYTRDPKEAKIWDLNFKIVSSEGDTVYTLRYFFRQSKYFQTLFTSDFKENQDNTLHLNITTKTLDKYLCILSGKYKDLNLTDEELVDLIGIADQQDLKIAVKYLINPLVEKEIIPADYLYRLVETYDLTLFVDVTHIIHLEEFVNCLNLLGEPVVWDCFDGAWRELTYYKFHSVEEPPISFEEYKKIILACHDRFPDKAMMFRSHTCEHTCLYKKHKYDGLSERLRDCLMSKDLIFDFRDELVEIIDSIISIEQ